LPLLRRVAEGDRAAVPECVTRFGGVVWSLARRLSASESEAEDAVQEIFVDLWKSAGRFDPALSSEVAFVAMIARRRLIDRRRRLRRRPEEAPGELVEATSLAAHPDTCVEAEQALRAMDSLRPEQRDILVLSTVQGMSHAEIARRKGIPLGTVKAHARRALLRIRSLLFGPADGDPAAMSASDEGPTSDRDLSPSPEDAS
jgi:RNA polymerase sigma-70 factor (ECF subfamily)